jgi:predicted kinase
MEQPTVSKLATEALKPFSGLIDALLSAKLKRIRTWAERRELDSRLASRVVDTLLNTYLKRLLRRISGVTTIAFPQQLLPLTAIYEPLTLNEEFSGDQSDSFEFSIAVLDSGRNCVIVDSAGMGKSTFVKHLVLEILNLTTKIPIFLELRRISESETILGKLCSEIDETKSDVDERLLTKLLEDGNFVIILDGYDELPENLRPSIGEEITRLAVLSSENSLVLTSRPEVNLPEIPDSTLYHINQLNRYQAESLLRRYDAIASLDVGEKLINQLDSVNQQFLQTPLLIVLLYRTYGFNQSIATRVSSFYDEVFNALYKGHDLTKAGFARPKLSKLDTEDFRRLLRAFAFLLAARQQEVIVGKSAASTIVSEAIKLCGVQPTTPSAFFDDLLLAVPLIVNDGIEFRFIHRSLGEFFAAEFLAYQAKGDLISRIRDGRLNNSFINCFQYLSDINPNVFRRLIVAPLAKSIITTPNPPVDPRIRSLAFIAEAAFSLWAEDQVKEGGTVTIPKAYPTMWYCYGTLKGKEHVLVLGIPKVFRRMPEAAWLTVTDPLADQKRPEIVGLDFDTLDPQIPLQQWVPITSPEITRNGYHKAIRETLERALAGRGAFIEEDVQSIRVISLDACKTLLLEIKEESRTEEWLANLVEGNTAP